MSSVALLVHHADVIAIEGESHRLREAEKRATKTAEATRRSGALKWPLVSLCSKRIAETWTRGRRTHRGSRLQ
jgi:hypothetical protein